MLVMREKGEPLIGILIEIQTKLSFLTILEMKFMKVTTSTTSSDLGIIINISSMKTIKKSKM